MRSEMLPLPTSSFFFSITKFLSSENRKNFWSIFFSLDEESSVQIRLRCIVKASVRHCKLRNFIYQSHRPNFLTKKTEGNYPAKRAQFGAKILSERNDNESARKQPTDRGRGNSTEGCFQLPFLWWTTPRVPTTRGETGIRGEVPRRIRRWETEFKFWGEISLEKLLFIFFLPSIIY